MIASLFKNGFKLKLKNRRVILQENSDKTVNIVFKKLINSNDPKIPTIHFKQDDKVFTTGIKLTEEAMTNMCLAYLKYKEINNK